MEYQIIWYIEGVLNNMSYYTNMAYYKKYNIFCIISDNKK